jgi:hypothetical protein
MVVESDHGDQATGAPPEHRERRLANLTANHDLVELKAGPHVLDVQVVLV